MDLIDRQAAIDEVHGAIYEFFDFCEDDEESPITHKDEQLLELNKAITIRIKQLPSARPKGKWIIKDNPGTGWYRITCSECGEDVTSTAPCIGFFPNAKVIWDFCPNCGSDNREVE